MSTTNVFGLHAVQSVLQNNPKSVTRLLLSDSRKDKRLSEIETLAKSHSIAIDRTAPKELQKLIGEERHQGVVAVCRAREVLSEPELLKLVMSLDKAFLLVVDGVTDPHNLGAILRTADAAGVDCVIAPRSGSVGLTPVVRKVASHSGRAQIIGNMVLWRK